MTEVTVIEQENTIVVIEEQSSSVAASVETTSIIIDEPAPATVVVDEGDTTDDVVAVAEQGPVGLQGPAGVVGDPALWAPSGAISETFSRVKNGSALTNISLASGVLYLFAGMTIPPGETVEAITFMRGTSALFVPTHQWFSLYGVNHDLLAVTIDDTNTPWLVSTRKTLLLLEPFTNDSEDHLLVRAGITITATIPGSIRSLPLNLALQLIAPELALSADGGLSGPSSAPAIATKSSTAVSLAYAYTS